jgi:hypothetical protein
LNTDCANCFYNRSMRAWGETFDACWYTHDNRGKELHTSKEVECSGFDEKEKQLEIILNGGSTE